MKKLDKHDLAQLDAIATRLREGREELDTAIDAFNAKRSAAWEILTTAIETYNDDVTFVWEQEVEGLITQYNDAVSEYNSWKTDIAQRIADYMDGRSEKWQESDAGSRYQSWKEGYEEETPTAELEAPERIELDEADEITLDLEDAAEEQLALELE